MKPGRTTIAVLVFELLTFACGSDAIRSQIGSPNDLPTASATLHWATVSLPRGSYCWTTRDKEACVDSSQVSVPRRNGRLDGYRTAGGFRVQIVFHPASELKAFDVRLSESPVGTPSRVPDVAPRSFDLPASPPASSGFYLYEITGSWSEGKVTFFLPIQLIVGVA